MKIIENRKIFFAVSVVLICIGLVAMALNANAGRGALNWDVEFTGGTSMELDMGGAFENDTLEDIVREVTGQTSPQIQQVIGTNSVGIKLQSIDSEMRVALMDAVTKTYPDAELTEANDISGTVSGEMQQATRHPALNGRGNAAGGN